TARGRVYYYYQRGRGTPHIGPRIKLPDDPHAPEFWQAVRQAQGIVGTAAADTVGALIDAYVTSPAFTLPREEGGFAESAKTVYRGSLRIAREAWGALPANGIRPIHVQAVIDKFAATAAKANNFRTAMRVLSAFGRKRDLIAHSFVEGVEGRD